MVFCTRTKPAPLVAGVLGLMAFAASIACGEFSDPERPRQRQGEAEIERELVIPASIFKEELDNGMTVVVVRDRYASQLQLDVRHLVGSREDPDDAPGMAHLVEHLMFDLPEDGKQVGERSIGDVATILGAETNAYTDLDETHYMLSGPIEHLERYFQFTAARLDFDCEAITKARFDREREVVGNEYRTRGEFGGRALRRLIDAELFDADHPYAGQRQADSTSNLGITREAACQWAKQYYTTRRTHVVVTGNVEAKSVFALARKVLEPVQRNYSHPRTSFEPREFKTGVRKIGVPVDEPHAYLIFPHPTRFDPQRANADVSVHRAMLGLSGCARNAACAVAEFDSFEIGGKEDPFMAFSLSVKSGRKVSEATDDAFEMIKEAFYEKGNAYGHKAYFDLSRQSVRTQVIARLADLRTRGPALADYLEQRDPHWHHGDLAALDSLFVSQSDAYGRQVFDRKMALEIQFLPNGQAGTLAERDQPTSPRDEVHERLTSLDGELIEEARGPLVVSELVSDRQRDEVYEAPFGLRVVLARTNSYPLIQTWLTIRSGDAAAGGLSGIAALAANARTVPKGDHKIELMRKAWLSGAISFPSFVDARSTSFIAQGLSIYSDHILGGLATWALHGKFDSGQIDGWRANELELLGDARTSIHRRNGLRFAEALLGEGHPMAAHRPSDSEELAQIDADRVASFRRKHHRASNATLILAGNLEASQMAAWIERYFASIRTGGWATRGAPPKSRGPGFPRRDEALVLGEIDPVRARFEISLGFPTPSASLEEWLREEIAAAMLDQTMLSLRTREAMTYGVHAHRAAKWPALILNGSFDAANAKVALERFMAAHQALFERETFAREFAIARRRVVARILARRSAPTSLAAHYQGMAAMGFGSPSPHAVAAEAGRLSAAGQFALMKEGFAPGQGVFYLEGPASAFEQLETIEGVPAIEMLEALPRR